MYSVRPVLYGNDCYQPVLTVTIAPRHDLAESCLLKKVFEVISYSCCRRPALVAPSLGVVGTGRSSVRIARPTTTTDEDNVDSFGLKEMASDGPSPERVYRCRLHPSNGVRPHLRGLRQCPCLVLRLSASSISFSHYLPNPLD